MSAEAVSIKGASEKADVTPVIEAQVYQPETSTAGIDERKLMRKIDWHVVPWLSVLYLLNFLDRGNIGNARVRNE